MSKLWITAILLFLVITFIVIKIFNSFYERETSQKMRKTWGAKMYYWHFIIMISGLVTTLVIVLVKQLDILKFE